MAFKKHLIDSFFFGLIGVLISAFYLSVVNIELIREYIEDPAFDFINYTVLENKNDSVGSKVLLYCVDDDFLFKEKLITNDKRPTNNYGYVLPRKYITKFINELENNKYINPKALIIDYDLDFPLNRISLNNDERILLETLQNFTKFKIYIVSSNNNATFISKDKIKNKNIVFGSVSFEVNNDNLTRRYEACISKDDNCSKSDYYYIPLLINEQNLSLYKQKRDIIGYRIVYKGKLNKYSYKENTYWNNLEIRSIANISRGVADANDSIVIIGACNSSINKDKSLVKKMFNDTYLSNAYILANSILSIRYFNGSLKILPWYFFVSISFMIFSISYLMGNVIYYMFSKFLFVKNRAISFIYKYIDYDTIVLLVLLINLFVASVILLLKYKLWYNYYIFQLLIIVLNIVKFFIKKESKV